MPVCAHMYVWLVAVSSLLPSSVPGVKPRWPGVSDKLVHLLIHLAGSNVLVFKIVYAHHFFPRIIYLCGVPLCHSVGMDIRGPLSRTHCSFLWVLGTELCNKALKQEIFHDELLHSPTPPFWKLLCKIEAWSQMSVIPALGAWSRVWNHSWLHSKPRASHGLYQALFQIFQ